MRINQNPVFALSKMKESEITDQAFYFMDSNIELKSMNLDLIHISPPLYGVTFALELQKNLKEWGIEDKVFAATSDSGGNCFLAQELLNGQKSKTTKITFAKIIQFNNRCASHSIQTIIKYGFDNGVDLNKDERSLNNALTKIRS